MLLEPSEIFKVLGVETRVKIIELLKSNGPLGVKDISSDLGVTPSAINQAEISTYFLIIRNKCLK